MPIPTVPYAELQEQLRTAPRFGTRIEASRIERNAENGSVTLFLADGTSQTFISAEALEAAGWSTFQVDAEYADAEFDEDGDWEDDVGEVLTPAYENAFRLEAGHGLRMAQRTHVGFGTTYLPVPAGGLLFLEDGADLESARALTFEESQSLARLKAETDEVITSYRGDLTQVKKLLEAGAMDHVADLQVIRDNLALSWVFTGEQMRITRAGMEGPNGSRFLPITALQAPMEGLTQESLELFKGQGCFHLAVVRAPQFEGDEGELLGWVRLKPMSRDEGYSISAGTHLLTAVPAHGVEDGEDVNLDGGNFEPPAAAQAIKNNPEVMEDLTWLSHKVGCPAHQRTLIHSFDITVRTWGQHDALTDEQALEMANMPAAANDGLFQQPAGAVAPTQVPQRLADLMGVNGALPMTQLRSLPAYLKESIRIVGRDAFRPHTGVAMEDIQIVSAPGHRVRPALPTDVDAHSMDRLVGFLRANGETVRERSVQEFERIPNYRPMVETRRVNGIDCLIVEDHAGTAVYAWPSDPALVQQNHLEAAGAQEAWEPDVPQL